LLPDNRACADCLDGSFFLPPVDASAARDRLFASSKIAAKRPIAARRFANI